MKLFSKIKFQMGFCSRLKKFITDQGMKVSSFEKFMGFSNGSLRVPLETGGSITSTRLESIFSKFPDLNPNWLMTGRGTMYLSESSAATADDLRKTIESMERVIQLQGSINAELKSQLEMESMKKERKVAKGVIN